MCQWTHPRRTCTCTIRTTESSGLEKLCELQHWDSLPKAVVGESLPLEVSKQLEDEVLRDRGYPLALRVRVGLDLRGFSSLDDPDSLVLPDSLTPRLIPAIPQCRGIPGLISASHIFSSPPYSCLPSFSFSPWWCFLSSALQFSLHLPVPHLIKLLSVNGDCSGNYYKIKLWKNI